MEYMRRGDYSPNGRKGIQSKTAQTAVGNVAEVFRSCSKKNLDATKTEKSSVISNAKRKVTVKSTNRHAR